MDHPVAKERYFEPSLQVTELPNPFDGLTEEAKSEAIRQVAENSRLLFKKSLSRITDELLPAINPLHTLAHFAFYDGLLIPACDRVKPPKNSQYVPLEQGHIELLQALILHLPSDRLQGRLEPGYPQILQSLQQETASLFRSWTLSRFDASRRVEKVQLLEFFRARTAMIRNWGDTNQVICWLKELFAPEDDKLEGRYGVSFTRLIECVRSLLDLLQYRLDARRTSLSPVLNAATKEEMISKYLEIEDQSESARSEGYARMMELAVDREQLKAILFTHFDLDLWKVFSFDLHDFDPGFSDEERAGIRTIFDRWSLKPESLASQNIDHIFMNNPVWQSPLIKLTRDAYYWPLIHVFQSFGLEMLTALLSEPERVNFERTTKSDFAEGKLKDLFEKAFPAAAIYTNTQYSIDGTQFENDCCVVLDAYCFVVEVKSGKLKSSAKRGSAISLEQSIDALVGEGSTQANRFIAALQGDVPLRDERGLRTIDISRVRHFVPMVVTFEHLGEVAANKNALIEAGFLRTDTLNTLCLCLPDLERVFQILPSTAQRLHYLVRRISIERHFKFRGDELDLLVFYLKTGFAIGDAEFEQERPIMFGGLSTVLDTYLLDTDGIVARPSRFLTPRWKDILEQIQTRRFPNWTEAALILLGIDREGMEGFEDNLNQVYRSVSEGRHKVGDNDIVICGTGPERRRQAFGFTVACRQTREQREAHVQSALAMIEKEFGQVDALIFALDLALPIAPYHGIYFVEGGKWERT